MSDYNSENTVVLSTTQQKDGNTRMLLLYTRPEDGSHEYIIGSYFKQEHYDGTLGYERMDYSWYWGHYFNDLADAFDYWRREVLSEVATIGRFEDGWATCPICGEDVYDTDLYCAHCGSSIHQV